jgi:hypothetical protein
MSLYGLLMAAAIALFFSVRHGRGWTQKWRQWMFGESPDGKPPRKGHVIT